MGTPIRVGVVATSPLLHEGLVRVLHEDPALSVFPHMQGWDKLAVPTRLAPADLMILHMPEPLPPASWRKIAELCVSTKVLILLRRLDPDATRQALQFGVTGILTENTDSGTMVKAIHEVAAGGLWCDPAPSLPNHDGVPKPSSREREVLVLIRCGLSNRDIADRLYISERTVKSHVNRLLHKFRVKNRVQLVLCTDERLDWVNQSSVSLANPG